MTEMSTNVDLWLGDLLRQNLLHGIHRPCTPKMCVLVVVSQMHRLGGGLGSGLRRMLCYGFQRGFKSEFHRGLVRARRRVLGYKLGRSEMGL